MIRGSLDISLGCENSLTNWGRVPETAALKWDTRFHSVLTTRASVCVDGRGVSVKGGGMSDIIIFKSEAQQVEMRLEGETVWLSQKQMAELFDKDVRTVNEHIGNVNSLCKDIFTDADRMWTIVLDC